MNTEEFLNSALTLLFIIIVTLFLTLSYIVFKHLKGRDKPLEVIPRSLPA
ncbi:6-kDa hydrophobic protein a [Citrus associated ampelovirus 2]|nr:6-kDa hydrophobic protein a [Citrus associated ampelovirus 2]